MSEAGGALAFPSPGSDDELIYDLAFGEVSDADLAKKYGYKSVQSIWNKRSMNKERIAEIREARRRQLEVVHADKFEDLLVMKPLARMAGFNEAWRMALQKMFEIDARSYNPVTGEARPQSPAEARQFKMYYEVMADAARAVVELSGNKPRPLSDLDSTWIRLAHRDRKPRPEEPESEPEARTAERGFAPWSRFPLPSLEEMGPEFNERLNQIAAAVRDPEPDELDLSMFDDSAESEPEAEPELVPLRSGPELRAVDADPDIEIEIDL
jgi:hypothetical protein